VRHVRPKERELYEQTSITAAKFDSLANENKEDVIQYLDLESARRPGLEDSKRINIDLPSDFLAELDKEAAHRGITRQSLIKVWLEPSLTLASRPIAKSDVPGNVIVKTGNAP